MTATYKYLVSKYELKAIYLHSKTPILGNLFKVNNVRVKDYKSKYWEVIQHPSRPQVMDRPGTKSVAQLIIRFR